MFNALDLRVFLNSEENYLPREFEAMTIASLHVAIFSDNHVQSCWFWADLSFMCKTYTRIAPIFYHVKPEDVRCTKGDYVDGSYQNEKKGKSSPEKLREWKRVLYGFSHNMDHFVNSKKDEDGLLLKNFVSFVLKVMSEVPFVFTECAVGLDESVRDFELITIKFVKSYQTPNFRNMGYGRFRQNHC